MENSASFQTHPNQEDKSGRATYAGTAARNSSTIDPRTIEPARQPQNHPIARRVFDRFRKIFK